MSIHTLLRWRHWLALALLILAALGVMRFGASLRAGPPIPQLPPVMLWAWERPEDLRFLDAQQAGVAYLAGTVFLRAATIEVRPRLQPLRVAPGAQLMAVVRIEPDRAAPPSLTPEQRAAAVAAIAELKRRPGITAVQVDYDAPASHREFYSALLRDLRGKLPPGTALSITALASWCLGDRWLDGLPVDEAVPMLFQMGPEGAAVRLHLMQGRDFSSPVCRGSLGLATNEPVQNAPRGRRVYLFHGRAWNAESARTAIAGAQL